MTSQPFPSRRLARVCCGLAVATTLATSACAAGRRAQTAEQKPTLDGTEVSVGDLDLRGLAIAPPTKPSFAPGQSVQLRLVVVNTGHSDDHLISITSPAITSWGSYASAAAAQAAQAPTPAVPAAGSSASSLPSASSASTGSSGSPSSTSSSRKSASSSGARSSGSRSSGSPSTSTSKASPVLPPTTSAAVPSPAPQPSRSVVIPTGGAASWGVPSSKTVLVLSSVKQRLFPGTQVRLTFTFAKAGKVTTEVPVALAQSPDQSTVPATSQPTGSPTG